MPVGLAIAFSAMPIARTAVVKCVRITISVQNFMSMARSVALQIGDILLLCMSLELRADAEINMHIVQRTPAR
jgi:hypothetical protein